MFSFLTKLGTIDFSNFDTTYAIDMNNMFDCCNSIEHLDLTSCNLYSLEEANNMFIVYCLKDNKVSKEE